MLNSSDKSGNVVSQEVDHCIGTCIESIRHLKDFKRDIFVKVQQRFCFKSYQKLIFEILFTHICIESAD